MSALRNPSNDSIFFAVGIGLTAFLFACSTQTQIRDDSSQFAVEARANTLSLGSDCFRALELGYSYCPVTDHENLPKLRILFLNPAEYAVSDCFLGIHEKGSVDHAGLVEINLSGLDEQAKQERFCLVKVEAIEHYLDPNDPTQTHDLPLTGGFFIEVLPENYFPKPTKSQSSWCYQVSQTIKGRSRIDRCE
jgi:hypothetical protein